MLIEIAAKGRRKGYRKHSLRPLRCFRRFSDPLNKRQVSSEVYILDFNMATAKKRTGQERQTSDMGVMTTLLSLLVSFFFVNLRLLVVALIASLMEMARSDV